MEGSSFFVFVCTRCGKGFKDLKPALDFLADTERHRWCAKCKNDFKGFAKGAELVTPTAMPKNWLERQVVIGHPGGDQK
jgi:hypothetical protein